MRYKEYTIEQFLKDEYFVNWIIAPNAESDYFWKEWMRLNPEKIQVIESARQLVQSIEYEYKHKFSDGRYHQILENILQHNRSARSKKSPAFLSSNWMGGLAASFTILLLAGIYFFNYKNSEDYLDEPVHTVTKTTSLGQKKTIGLPDGTIVKLNTGSKLIYTQPFNEKQREVKLEGEAFFEVAKDVERPFIIQSGRLKTKVLGTSFNIRSYKNEKMITVAVLTGKVKIANENGESDILFPEDMGVYNKEDKEITKTNFDSKNVFGWKDGILVFKDMEIKDIFSILEKWYGIKIRVDKDIMITGKYTGEYQNASLERVLDGISYTSKFSYKINTDEVLITKQIK
ncbi:FecR domain-containing protein [Fulvivirgaceae bacterium BMA12]|uniref:FecR domain-containing protein n=1 Tax=Agaribacillus aureus TaxID=3051825 RepID=A0ABT8L0Y5_9BACT|nr:FecR domain-containing protein [Fulvivirgaceae bacterium BMA12]